MASRTRRTGSKSGSCKSGTAAFKINLRSKDNAPLAMTELRDCLMEAVRELLKYERDCRAKSATLYVPLVDRHGQLVRIDAKNELTLYSYRAAADEHGL
jgi:hypothetical protein